MTGEHEKPPGPAERLLEQRAAETDDAAWLSPQAEARVRAQLAEERRSAALRRRVTRLRLFVPLAAAAALLVFLFVRPDPVRPPAALAWQLLDGAGRPVETELRGGAADPRVLEEVLVELHVPADADARWARVVALAEGGVVALGDADDVELEPGTTAFLRRELPAALGAAFDVALVLGSEPFAVADLPELATGADGRERWIERCADGGLRASTRAVSRATR